MICSSYIKHEVGYQEYREMYVFKVEVFLYNEQKMIGNQPFLLQLNQSIESIFIMIFLIEDLHYKILNVSLTSCESVNLETKAN